MRESHKNLIADVFSVGVFLIVIGVMMIILGLIYKALVLVMP